MAELADAADSKSVVLKRRVGSTPTFGTAHQNGRDSNPASENGLQENRLSGGQIPGQQVSPREALIGALANAVRDAAIAGDLMAARVSV